VLSYVALRGRCRHCGRRFSPRYALVELLTAGLAVLAVYNFNPTPYAAIVFFACCALIVALFVDLDHMIIPDEVPVILLGLGILTDLYRILTEGSGSMVSFSQQIGSKVYVAHLPMSLTGMVVGGGLFLIIGWVFERALRKPALGLGDVKLAAGMGALLGPGYLFLCFFLLAILSGAIISVLLMAFGLRRREQSIPFGPMLAVAAMAVLLWPDVIAPWMLRFYGG
jgi:leader peptidase (prepilin peptidase)/N-methyltransferase